MSTNASQDVRIELLEKTTAGHNLELYGSPGETEKAMVMIVNNHTKQLDRILNIFKYIYYSVIAGIIGVLITSIANTMDWMK